MEMDLNYYTDRLDITLSEWPEDPYTGAPGTVYYVRAAWKDGSLIKIPESRITVAIGRGPTREDAIESFRRALVDAIEKTAEDDRRRQIKATRTESITL